MTKTTNAPTEHVAFLLIDDFAQLAFANAIEPFRIANLVSGQPLYCWSLVAEDGEKAICSNGAVTLADRGLDPLTPGDRLFVISGSHVRERISRPVLDFLRRERRRGVQLGGICSGAYILAKAGLLDGLSCAMHWAFHDAFVEEFSEVALQRTVFVGNEPVVTASGGPAAADLMLHLIAQTHGGELATEVADQMVYNTVRSDDARQRLSFGPRLGFRSEALNRAVREMEAHLEDTIPVSVLAERVGVSARQLERLFGRHLNCSPKKYYLDLRLARGRNLLLQTDLSVQEISIACGFSTSANFTRAYRQTHGVTPTAERGVAPSAPPRPLATRVRTESLAV